MRLRARVVCSAQFDLEVALKAALSEGRRIENDTLFAFRFDKERERADGAKLGKLVAAVQELESIDLPDHLRAHEPTNLGTHWSQQDQPQLACDSEGARFHWTPWHPGTRTHARFVELAYASVEGAQAAPAGRRTNSVGL